MIDGQQLLLVVDAVLLPGLPAAPVKEPAHATLVIPRGASHLPLTECMCHNAEQEAQVCYNRHQLEQQWLGGHTPAAESIV